MAASNPAVEWWETDPKSPGNLEQCEIALRLGRAAMPGVHFPRARGYRRAEVYARPMFEVLPQ